MNKRPLRFSFPTLTSLVLAGTLQADITIFGAATGYQSTDKDWLTNTTDDIDSNGLGTDGYIFFGDFDGMGGNVNPGNDQNENIFGANAIASTLVTASQPTYILTAATRSNSTNIGSFAYEELDNPLLIGTPDEGDDGVGANLLTSNEAIEFTVSGLAPATTIRVGVVTVLNDDNRARFPIPEIGLTDGTNTATVTGLPNLSDRTAGATLGWVFFDIDSDGDYIITSPGDTPNPVVGGIGGVTFDTVSLAVPTWQTDGDGDWTTAGNWSSSVPNGVSAEAIFNDTLLTGPLTASLDSPITLGDLLFFSAQDITIGGPSALTFDGGGAASVSATAGSHVISADVSLTDPLDVSLDPESALDISGTLSGASSLTSSGAGELTLSGSFSNSIISDAESLVVSGIGSSGDITVNTDSTLSGEGSHTGTLNLATGSTLSIDPTNGTSAFTTGTLSPTAPVTLEFSSSPLGLTGFTVLNYTTYGGTAATDFVNPGFRLSTQRMTWRAVSPGP